MGLSDSIFCRFVYATGGKEESSQKVIGGCCLATYLGYKDEQIRAKCEGLWGTRAKPHSPCTAEACIDKW